MQDDGDMAVKIGEEDREQMETALAEALSSWRAPRGKQRRRTMRRSSGRWRRCAAQSSSMCGGRDGGMVQDGRVA
jgi:hypothetical protein